MTPRSGRREHVSPPADDVDTGRAGALDPVGRDGAHAGGSDPFGSGAPMVPDLEPLGLAATLDEALAGGRARVRAAMRGLLDALLARVPETIVVPIRYAVEDGGKRLRPVLCLAAYDAAGGCARDPCAVAELACALELIHTYSLIHDDLPCMDDDDLRRGRPTVHRAFGVARATVAGAALIPLAAAAGLRACARLGLDDCRAAELVRDLCAAAGGGGMVGGQWLDLAAEGREVSAPALEALHGAKTGALMAAALRLGARAAGADDAVVAAMGAYGRRLGLAFQIADDILDVTAPSEVLGKIAGRDAELHKATYPALLGLEGARARARAEAAGAVAALREAGIRAPLLEALAQYAVARDR